MIKMLKPTAVGIQKHGIFTTSNCVTGRLKFPNSLNETQNRYELQMSLKKP